jgi:CSLREA domain-containing protein
MSFPYPLRHFYRFFFIQNFLKKINSDSVKFIKSIIYLFIVFLIFYDTAQAVTFTVTKTADTSGVCSPTDCSLREAILDDFIEFSALFSTPQTITLSGNQLFVSKTGTLTINGPGADLLKISGNHISRVFLFNFNVTAIINNIHITEGLGISAGGGIFSNSNINLTINNSIISNNSAIAGGGIVNNGMMTLNNSIVSNNTAAGPSPNGNGGGIQNNRTMTINNSTVDNNIASDIGGGIISGNEALNINNSTISNNSSENGGGIFNSGMLQVVNSTISGNASVGSGNGGGINNQGGDTTTLINATVNNNSTDGNGGGIRNAGAGTVNSLNTIIANNSAGVSGPDFWGTLNSQGYNLIENTSGFTIMGTTTGNILGVDPQLAPLANYGGNTSTHALALTSPAIDQGSAATIPFIDWLIDSINPAESSSFLMPLTNDQRGFTRPFDDPGIANAVGGNGSDIGAFERLSPTSASIRVSGRVLTKTNIQIPGAIVRVSNSKGILQVARTNSFGSYNFEELEAGETYIFIVYSKQYQFIPRVVNLNDSLEDLDFIPN